LAESHDISSEINDQALPLQLQKLARQKEILIKLLIINYIT